MKKRTIYYDVTEDEENTIINFLKGESTLREVAEILELNGAQTAQWHVTDYIRYLYQEDRLIIYDKSLKTQKIHLK